MNRVDLSDESGALAPLTRATSNGLYAVDRRSPRRRPSVSRVETTVFRRTNRWFPHSIGGQEASLLARACADGRCEKSLKNDVFMHVERRICHSITPSVTLSVTY